MGNGSEMYCVYFKDVKIYYYISFVFLEIFGHWVYPGGILKIKTDNTYLTIINHSAIMLRCYSLIR